MKKVLIAVSTLTGGGAERVASVWANQLSEAGYDVSVLVNGRCDKEYPVSDKVKIFTIVNNYSEIRNLGYIERFKRMRKMIKEFSPDCVISFLPRMQIWMMGATFGLNLRRIETIRVSPWHININSKIERFLWKHTYRRADAVILQTAEQGEFFSKSVQKKSVVIPNPISEKFKNNPKMEYFRPVNFVAAGRITDQKNYPLMIEAFAEAAKFCPDIGLSIFGVGEKAYVEKVQALIDECGMTDRIVLRGRSEDMLSVLRSSDAFLMTSDYEGMPNALLEAMVVGLPCISTDCRTGPKDMIDDGVSGFLVKTGDFESISGAIVKIAQMSDTEAEKMGCAAREKILDICSEEKSLRKLIEVIENS